MNICWEEASVAWRGSRLVRGSVRKNQSRILVQVVRGPWQDVWQGSSTTPWSYQHYLGVYPTVKTELGPDNKGKGNPGGLEYRGHAVTSGKGEGQKHLIL